MYSDNTYWNSKGKYQHLVSKLEVLIPDEGHVPNRKSGGKALEKFRKAANCYHDLYNNGLCNRAAEFRQVFGIASSKYIGRCATRFVDELYLLVEEKMNEFIMAAAIEQHCVHASIQAVERRRA